MIKSDVEASVSFSMLGPWASDGGALDAGYIVQSFAPHEQAFETESKIGNDIPVRARDPKNLMTARP